MTFSVLARFGGAMVLTGMLAAQSAQAETVVRIGMTAADIPLTHGQPDQERRGGHHGVPGGLEVSECAELLGRALASGPTSSGARRATTTDGKVEIILRQPVDGAVAHLTTPNGRFSGPDYEIEIRAFGNQHARRAAR